MTQSKCPFSQEQWQEIYAVRARLEAYKLKVQPYPLLPDPQKEASKEQVIIHRHSNMGKLEYDILQQRGRQVKHLQAKVDELSARRKPKGKY